jgi:hypothetical protein
MSGQKWRGSDPALGLLLDMHGETFLLEGGFWTRIQAWLVEPRSEIPHGVRYSLSLHDRHGTRILAFDNAHGLRPERARPGRKAVAWDHQHLENKTEPYEFTSAEQLMVDFWEVVNSFLKSKRL